MARTHLLASLLALSLAACIGDPGTGTLPPAMGSGSGEGSGSGDPGVGSGSGSGSGSGTPATPPMTATQYLHARNVKMCDERFACVTTYPGNTQGGTFADMYGATPADCYAKEDMYAQAPQVEADITAGAIVFNSTLAQDCATTMTFPSDCTQFWANNYSEPASCGNAMRGTVADGDPCMLDYDCLNSGSTCEPNVHVCVDTGNAGTDPTK